MLLDDVQSQIQESAQKYFSSGNAGRPYRAPAPDWRRLAELGWVGLNVAEELGGAGLSAAYSSVLLERFGYWLVRHPYVFSAVMPSALLAVSPDEAIAEHIVSGQRRYALAWQDKAGQLVVSWQSVSIVQNSGGLILRGFKRFVPAWTPACDLLVCANRDSEPCLVHVPAHAQDVRSRTRALTDGSTSADLSFDGTSVPSNAILAHGDQAQLAMDRALALGTIGLSAQLCGAARGALDLTVRYISQRQQFGKTISSFQTVRHRVADIAMAIELASASWRRALLLFEAKSSAAETDFAISCAKASASEIALTASRQSVQLHGAIGYTEEADPGQYLNAALAWSSSLGGAAAHLRRMTSAQEHLPASRTTEQ